MKPLLDFRDRLVSNRNVSEYRCETRRMGNAQWMRQGTIWVTIQWSIESSF